MDEQKENLPLSERFNQAYKRIPSKLRKKMREEFCAVHQIAEGSFYHKLSGGVVVTLMECEWLERYDPYAQPITV